MLKNYFSVRVYVIIDACLLAVWLVSGINGWTVFAKYPYIAAGVWCILTIPLAAIGLLSVYQRVQLHHRKNVHTQYEYEQQTELRLEQMRQQYALPSPTDATIIEIDNKAGMGTIGSPGDGTQIGTLPVGTRTTQHKQDDNTVVAEQLRKAPFTSMTEMEKMTGIPRGSIGRTDAWKNRTMRNASA